MKDFIIVNGTMGAGKSTVCRELAELLPRCGFIEGDSCWTWRPDLGEAAKEMVLQNIAFLADSYLACPEYESVLLCWVIPEERIFAEILGRMKRPCRLHRFTLLLREDVLARRLERDILEGKRLRGVVERSLERYPAFAKMDTAKIDVSDCTPATAAAKILSEIKMRDAKTRQAARNKENG